MRLRCKLTQQELADKAEINRVTVSNIERGWWESSLYTLDRIAWAMDADWTIKLRKKR